MIEDPWFRILVKDMAEVHGCHTVILYGSRSRGDWVEESDVDVLAIREHGVKVRDVRTLEGRLLDAFIVPETEVSGAPTELLRIGGGVVLLERDGFGTRLLQEIERLARQGPAPIPEDERTALRVWIEKMLNRVSRDDVEARYREVWLKFELLELYFRFRGLWYRGPKEAFAWLAERDPETLAEFQEVLCGRGGLEALRSLARKVVLQFPAD